MSKFFSAKFGINYLYLYILSPYLLFLTYRLYEINKNKKLSNINFNNKHIYIILLLGIIAALYGYIRLAIQTSIFISIVFLLIYSVILGAIYKFNILNEQIKIDSLKKSMFTI